MPKLTCDVARLSFSQPSGNFVHRPSPFRRRINGPYDRGREPPGHPSKEDQGESVLSVFAGFRSNNSQNDCPYNATADAV